MNRDRESLGGSCRCKVIEGKSQRVPVAIKAGCSFSTRKNQSMSLPNKVGGPDLWGFSKEQLRQTFLPHPRPSISISSLGVSSTGSSIMWRLSLGLLPPSNSRRFLCLLVTRSDLTVTALAADWNVTARRRGKGDNGVHGGVGE